MFERDVQATLDDYLAGKISEAEFLANSRPWPRYERDYRPLVVLARARGWAVRAANVPRPIASLVSKKGLGAIDSLPDGSKGWVAKNFVCAHDAYFDRFAHAMTGHSGGGDPAPAADPAEMLATTNRFYEAQCVKDETMAESIANVFGRGVPGFSAPADPEPIVVHITGSFHSDYRQGTVDRTLRRRPDLRCIVITSVPSAHPAAEPISDAGARADYVIFTKKIGDATGK